MALNFDDKVTYNAVDIVDSGINFDTKGHDFKLFNFIKRKWDDEDLYTIRSTFPCQKCGELVFIMDNKIPDKDTDLDIDECELSDKDLVSESVISFPSGKAIVANSLLEDFEEKLSEEFSMQNSLNNILGRQNYFYEFAKHGVLFVSTIELTSFYSKTDGSYCFATSYLSDEDEYPGVMEAMGLKEELAETSGALWAFMAIDYDLFINSGKDVDRLMSWPEDVSIVDIDAGDYKITNYADTVEKHSYDPVIIADMQKIG